MRASYIDSTEQFTLGIMAYCGMFIPIIGRQDMADMADCRQKAARHLRQLRRDGFPIRTMEPGLAWEIEEPEDSVMVPDSCGTMRIKPVEIRLLACNDCDSDVPEGETCRNCEEHEEEHARWLRDMADRDEEEEAGTLVDCGCQFACLCHEEEPASV